MLVKTFIPHRLLSRESFEQLAADWLHFGNGYLERRNSVLGSPVSLQAPLAKYTRRGAELGAFY